MVEDVDVSCTLVRVTRAGRFGVARLKEPRDGLSLVVINDVTHGRISVMNRLGGQLMAGGEVRVRQLEKHREAFVALQVE